MRKILFMLSPSSLWLARLRLKHMRRITLALSVALGAVQASAQTFPYLVTLMGVQNSFGMATASGLNRWGQVIGQDSNAFNPHALLWTPAMANAATGTLYSLESAAGFPAGTASSGPSGINDRGQIVGTAYTPGQGDGNQTQSWMWRPSPLNNLKGTVLNGSQGKAVTFPQVTIPGAGSLAEYVPSINNNGTITAYGIYYHPLLWTPTPPNSLTGIWAYEPTYCGQPSGINDAGQIAGGTCESGSENVPYLHTGVFPLVVSDLITSPLWIQPPTPVYIGSASGLNKRGDLSISAVSVVSFIRAYLYRNGAATDISGGQDSRANGINDYDQVVGSITATSNATLFENGKAIDLNTAIPPQPAPLGYWLTSAVKINNAGQILCNGLYYNGGPYGTQAAFLLTPGAFVGNPVLVTKGTMHTSGSTYRQTVTVQNLGTTAIKGPVSVALDGLTPGLTLTNETGTTVYTGPGSVYVDVSPSDLSAGAMTTAFTLVFSNPNLKTINYTARVLGSSAPR